MRAFAALSHWSPGALPDGIGQTIRETVFWSPPELTAPDEEDHINSSLCHGFIFDFCGVEVDRTTLQTRIDRYVTMHDCGTILHPAMVDGQIRGGFAQAVGAALYEEYAYGSDGSFLTGTFADYLLPRGPIGAGLPATEHVMYTNCLPVAARPGAEVLVDVILSEFDRSYQHFVSHNQTPSSGRVGSAGIVRHGHCLYFAHKIFEQYAQYGSPCVKRLFLNGLNLLLGEPLLRHDGPSTLLATVTEQAAHDRWLVHLLHYIPQRRASELEIIEDVIPLYQVKVSLKLPRPARQVLPQPGGELPLETWEAHGRLEFVVPEVRGHQMVEVTFTD